MTKLFNANVKDSLGWKYDNAWVAIHQAVICSQDVYSSPDMKGPYEESCSVDAISYRANFWRNKADQEAGLQSRPLINKDNEEDETLFQVDLEHLQSIQVINSALTTQDKRFRLIELDVNRRSAS